MHPRRAGGDGFFMTAFPPLPLGEGSELPAVERSALLLDLDGTLLDIAPAPDRVVVTEGLADTLLRLRGLLGDALAIITGRPIEQIDALLPGVPYAVAGEHGGALRHSPEARIDRPRLPELPPDWLEAAEAFAAKRPGLLVERKRRGFTLHYRGAPQHAAAARDTLEQLVRARADQFALVPARKAWEIRPRGADKGTAIAALMERAPFAGRLPVFIGDDVTDEDGIRAAGAAGGVGLRVPEGFGDPAGVRTWLRALARLA